MPQEKITITQIPLIHKDYMPLIRAMSDAWDLKSYMLLNKTKYFISRHECLNGYEMYKEVTTNVI